MSYICYDCTIYYLTLEPPHPVLLLIVPRFEVPSPLLSFDHAVRDPPLLPENNPPDVVAGGAVCLAEDHPPQLPGRSQSQKERCGATRGSGSRRLPHKDAASPPKPSPVQKPGVHPLEFDEDGLE